MPDLFLSGFVVDVHSAPWQPNALTPALVWVGIHGASQW